MDPESYHCLRYKVTHTEAAILADVTTKLTMTIFNIPWEMEFASIEDYKEFLTIFEQKILLDIYNNLNKLNEAIDISPTLWLVGEDAFSKLLYTIRLEFVNSLQSGSDLYYSCLKMLYYAHIYFKCGYIKAPVMAFLEVYRFISDSYRENGWW
ncbi:unnamed protein product [Larinioides sclopetarius]|uniref:Uncharacterized protein n=1 Tax=Larinioides sclopetarius TaxID=280406 RepID=A0AAV1Z0F4_9ARAC